MEYTSEISKRNGIIVKIGKEYEDTVEYLTC